MTTVVAVHGIGARDPGCPDLAVPLAKAMAEAGADARLTLCYWGEDCGATLLAGGASLPADPPAVDPEGADLWALLDEDPYAELRWLLSGAHGDGEALPRPRQRSLANRVQDLVEDPDVVALAGAVGLGEVLAGAIHVVLNAEPTREALALPEDGVLRLAMARTVVATAMARAGTPGSPFPLTVDQANALVSLIVDPDRLGGAPGLGPRRWLANLVVARASRWADRRRAALTESATSYLGDIAKYLVDGAPLRTRIRAAIEQAEPPVVVVAHSLGGVACVELLAEPNPPAVRTLVTVGSQAGYLYEIDALARLPFGTKLPPKFPLWLNMLDPRDLLAFATTPLFKGHAHDRVVDNRAPFPRAHRADFYLNNPAFPKILEEALR